MSFEWIVPPSAWDGEFRQHPENVMVALLAIGQRAGTEMQNQAKRDAPWTDRTGNARTGLIGTADKIGATQVEIVLGHTVVYGVKLELGHGRRFAVVEATIENYLPQLEGLIREVFGA